MGKTVIVIDLNPLSRSAQRASITIVDELSRVLNNLLALSESEVVPVNGTTIVQTFPQALTGWATPFSAKMVRIPNF